MFTMDKRFERRMRRMQELEQYFVIETSPDLYVVEDELFEEKVLDGVLELAVRFNSIDQAQKLLDEMKKEKINARIRSAKLIISA